MSRFKGPLMILLALSLLLGSATLSAAPPSSAPAGISVGEFALRVTRLLQDDPASLTSTTPEKAISALQRAGFRFGTAPEALLTEAEMSDFFHQAGIQLQAGRSAGPVSSAAADRVLSIFAGYFSARSNETLARVVVAPPSRMVAHAALPEDFSECVALPTVPECKDCCHALPGSSNKLCGRSCGRSHAAQNVSSSEPTP